MKKHIKLTSSGIDWDCSTEAGSKCNTERLIKQAHYPFPSALLGFHSESKLNTYIKLNSALILDQEKFEQTG